MSTNNPPTEKLKSAGALMGWLVPTGLAAALRREDIAAALPSGFASAFPKAPPAQKRLTRLRDHSGRWLPPAQAAAEGLGHVDVVDARWRWSHHAAAQRPEGTTSATTLLLDGYDVFRGARTAPVAVAVVGAVKGDHGDSLYLDAPNGHAVPADVEAALRAAWAYFADAIVSKDLVHLIEAVGRQAGGKSAPHFRACLWIPPAGVPTVEALRDVLVRLGQDCVGLAPLDAADPNGIALARGAVDDWIDGRLGQIQEWLQRDEETERALAAGERPKGSKGVGQRPVRYAQELQEFLEEAEYMGQVLDHRRRGLGPLVEALQERMAALVGVRRADLHLDDDDGDDGDNGNDNNNGLADDGACPF